MWGSLPAAVRLPVGGGHGLAVLCDGYSINIYEVSADELPDLSRTELTWDGLLGVDAWGDNQ